MAQARESAEAEGEEMSAEPGIFLSTGKGRSIYVCLDCGQPIYDSMQLVKRCKKCARKREAQHNYARQKTLSELNRRVKILEEAVHKLGGI
jgi:DNA-directed RNA polymerase subunit RPC12/RpoP